MHDDAHRRDRGAEHLGATLRAQRRALGLTQAELADLAGVSLRFLIEAEQGKPTARLDRLTAVATALGLRLELRLIDPNAIAPSAIDPGARPDLPTGNAG